ncbi:unnamed protein product [Arabidopsis thaliana]|uniref:Uncharacterized protein n=1 Tax=Arabidopsis thaliana TaxID=3702 RepID=A0A5S9XWD5_ARATH|nr:unnamed protein product [Arabidopsis thaliana]
MRSERSSKGPFEEEEEEEEEEASSVKSDEHIEIEDEDETFAEDPETPITPSSSFVVEIRLPSRMFIPSSFVNYV